MAKKAPASAPAAAPRTADTGVDDALFPTADDMSSAEEIWSGGQEEAAKSNPQGTFQMEITSAELQRSASSDRLQIHYGLKILNAGPFKDIEVNKYDGLGSKVQASITQRQLQRIGIDTKSATLKTLPAHLLSVVGLKIIATAKQNGEFYNINFVKVLTGDATAGQAAGVGPAPAAGKGAAGPSGRKPAF